jgi:PBSX family phage terminase large subunit
MQDNPTLSREIRLRYHSLYSGVFYKRYILGLWIASDGLVYPGFDPKIHVVKSLPQTFDRFYISCDYGIINPSSFGLWGRSKDKWYRIKEYYYDSKIEGASRTDLEHYEALERLADENDIEAIIVDPSASSFIECIKRGNKFKVIRAKNEVILGINHVSNALRSGKLLFSDKCQDSVREFSLYEWNKGKKNDEPKKQNDHAMDEIRYFVETILNRKQSGQAGMFCSANRYSEN